MAAVERTLVEQGWHQPRWRTTSKEYGKFYKQCPTLPSRIKPDPLLPQLHGTPRLRHIVDYINCNDRCRPPHLHQIPTPGAVRLRENDVSPAPQLDQSGHQDPALNAHIQQLSLEEESATIDGAEQFPLLKGEHVNETTEASVLDERPPWKPKPLKPMILFEKIARDMEKERSLDRQMPSYKRKQSGGWVHSSVPPSKRQQISHNPRREEQQLGQKVNPTCRRYSYYKYYGYGGQGAKTSWGHNRPLGQKPPFSRRTHELAP
ncbi:hypothetical protein KP509_15G070700 [Ceratopteris richardii]|uniref:Uncharacterized protein n=1 Tax=Ceratopteris richardii TaxID=49495 RepID=A0A8T2T6E7_CERRI|nr:hypothetical protein KP509_15G070700 [Ceratopteris richardii]